MLTYLKRRLKIVLDKLGLLGPVFRFMEALRTLRPRKDERLANGLAADGLPIPPGHLIVLVGGHNNATAFLHGGETIARGFRDMLQRQGVEFEKLESILDFGCGCGRIIRYLKPLTKARLYGTDYNPKLVDWCAKNLPFATFGLNTFDPPFTYADRSFDFAYAFSVFTHIPEVGQYAWMKEMARVIRPGGHLLITTHGDGYLDVLDPEEQERYKAGEFISRYDSVKGTNLCSTYHPRAFLEKLAGKDFDLVEQIPGAAVQDFVLLRRTSN